MHSDHSVIQVEHLITQACNKHWKELYQDSPFEIDTAAILRHIQVTQCEIGQPRANQYGKREIAVCDKQG